MEAVKDTQWCVWWLIGPKLESELVSGGNSQQKGKPLEAVDITTGMAL